MDSRIIGNFISMRRRDLGMTQQQLADKLEVTNKAVSKWETGEGYPDITIVPELSRALNVTADELLNGESVRNGNGTPLKQEGYAQNPPETGRKFKTGLRKFLESGLLTVLGILLTIAASVVDFTANYTGFNFNTGYLHFYGMVFIVVGFIGGLIKEALIYFTARR